MAKPKLALLPAAQGSKLYSVLPSSGVGDFDFTRSGSATRINSQGLIETVASGVSRLNYPLIDGVVKGCPHHILEPQRLQKIQYSEDFSNAAWNKNSSGTGVTPIITPNYAISPDGTLNSTRVLFNKGSGTTTSDLSTLSSVVSVTSGATTIKSIYLKSNTTENYELIIHESLDASGTNKKKITATNQWQRFDVYGNVSSTLSGLTIGLREIGVTGISNTADVLVWGAQLEEGSYATSYIPNYGTSGGVTRSAETANGSGDAATFNDSEGVLFVDTSSENTVADNRIYLSDGTDNNRIFIILDKSQSSIKGYVRGTAGYALAITKVGYDVSLSHKVLIKYKSNDYSFWINGFEVGSETSSTILPLGLNQLSFNGTSNYNPFYGSTKQIQYYDTALNSEDLEKLTSWVSFTDMAEGQLYTIE